MPKLPQPSDNGAAHACASAHREDEEPSRRLPAGSRRGGLYGAGQPNAQRTPRVGKKAAKRGKKKQKRGGSDPLGGGRSVGLPPFPVDAFPGPLRRYIESIAEALPCPPDYPGAMMLPVLATFVGKRRSIEIKPGWKERPVLFCAAVGRSGDRKTPAFDKVTEPLKRMQARYFAEFAREMEAYKAMSPEQQAATPEPKLKQAFTTDTTIEAMREVLSSNPRGICFPSDELSGWARAIGQYKGGKGHDRQIWLSIWSSQTIVVNRVGKPPIVVPEPFVSVTGGIQPDALPDIVDDTREDGFAARVLFAFPDPVPHADWNEKTTDGSIFYESICDQLHDLEPQDDPLTVDPAAKEVWIDWVNGHRREEPPTNLCAHWSKAEGHCLRIALVLHLTRQLCNETRSEQVDEPSMSGAVALVEYFKAHARRVYKTVAEHTGRDRIPRAVQWVRKRGGSVTAREVRMNGLLGIDKTEKAVLLLRDLERAGHGKVTMGRQGSVKFRLLEKNPK